MRNAKVGRTPPSARDPLVALSGYVERPDGSWAAFSILVNNYNGSAAEVRGVMDRICTLIME